METSPIRNPALPCWTKPLRPRRRRVEQLQRGLPGCPRRTEITPVVCKPYNIQKCFKLVGLTAQEHFNTLKNQLLDPAQRLYLSLFAMKMTQVEATHTCSWQGFPWLEKRGHCGPQVCVYVYVVPLCHTGRGWNKSKRAGGQWFINLRSRFQLQSHLQIKGGGKEVASRVFKRP